METTVTPATVNLDSRICSRGPMSDLFRRRKPVRLTNDSRCFDSMVAIFWQDQSRALKRRRVAGEKNLALRWHIRNRRLVATLTG